MFSLIKRILRGTTKVTTTRASQLEVAITRLIELEQRGLIRLLSSDSIRTDLSYIGEHIRYLTTTLEQVQSGTLPFDKEEKLFETVSEDIMTWEAAERFQHLQATKEQHRRKLLKVS